MHMHVCVCIHRCVLIHMPRKFSFTVDEDVGELQFGGG